MTSQSFKSKIKLSAFAISLIRAARALVRDISVVYYVLRRRGKISSYLRNNSIRKLHLGASHSLLPGWLNTDIFIDKKELVYLDVTQRFPLPDHSMDYIFSEHMIEHIDYPSGQAMIRECFRVLKPGGILRTSTPNLEFSLSLYRPQQGSSCDYQEYFCRHELPDVTDNPNRGVFILNLGFRGWGHQFLYDKPTLEEALSKNGFETTICRPLESDDPHLSNIEQRGHDIHGEEKWNQLDTFVIEARKPHLKATTDEQKPSPFTAEVHAGV